MSQKTTTTTTTETTLRLSNQALGAVMLALQNSIMSQSDIVPVLQGLEFVNTEDGLVVLNPPTVNTDFQVEDEETSA